VTGVRAVHLAAVATQLLTRLPVRPRTVVDDDLRAAVALFPAVGVVVAATAIAVRAATGPLVGPGAATVLAIAATIVVTGAFHEDGLADSADGLWGGSSPEQRIAIMRDSRLGTYGATALFLSLALRWSLLAPLPLGRFAAAELSAHVLGRAAGVVLAASLPPVGGGEGLGAKVIGPIGTGTAVVVGGTGAAAAVVGGGRWWWILFGLLGLAVWVVRSTARRRLGGLTGDLLGAVTQLAHLAVLGAVVALHRAGWQ
jgi:adenosylcobinamide-GDP ribazoletransferase